MNRKMDLTLSRSIVASIAWLMVILPLTASPAYAKDAKQKMYERVFGDAARLDPDIVAKVKALPPGERLLIDRDGDGKNDEVWYIDTSPRHTDKAKPLLVRVIDEDGDLDEHLGPDQDSDLYIGDFNADGQVDVVIDYQDNDKDNDVDEMGIFYWMPHDRWLNGPGIRCWWAFDHGDDNQLWYDVNLTYDQQSCQWRSHFSGDEAIVAFGLAEDSDHWISIWENPFLFYDPDKDGCSEVVMRFSGLAEEVEALRYSYDIDNDAFGRHTHDYDFSITAIAPGSRFTRGDNQAGSDLKMPGEFIAGMNIRGIPTSRWLQRQHAQKFAAQAPWAKTLLTWDELNANIDFQSNHQPYERWEGILNHPSEHFPQVGGPSCGALNKRNEIALNHKSPLRLYYDPSDHRLHLKGANKGWLHVDYNLDGKVDAKYTYLDENNDGIFDRRQIDLTANGQPEFDWKMPGPAGADLELEFESLNSFYMPKLKAVLADSQAFVDAVYTAISVDFSADPYTLSRDFPDRVQAFFLRELPAWKPEYHLGERMRKTPAGARFYLDLLRDRMLYKLQVIYGQHKVWPKIESLYAAGDYRAAADMILKELAPDIKPLNTRSFAAFTHRIPVRFDNTGKAKRVDWPTSLKVREIKEVAEDFNPDNCMVVAPERWIEWRPVPHQIDEIDSEIGPELSFLIDAEADSTPTYYIYYSPTGKREHNFAIKTDADEDWIVPNIGWESNRVAYRSYHGQFDFFGKFNEQLIFKGIRGRDYHHEIDGSIDGLHVGPTPGIGGLTLYVGDEEYLVQNPEGKGNVKIEKRILTKGPVRSAIEIKASNILPTNPDLTIRLHCLVYAERQETEIRVKVSGAYGEVVLAPGFTKLPRQSMCAEQKKGFFGIWGYQEPLIGDIGMGLIAPPDAYMGIDEKLTEYRSKYHTIDGGKLRYWLIGDWKNGRQYPVAPTIDNWRQELEQLANLLLNDATITIGQSEKVQ